MVEIFTLNDKGKIEFTKEELKELLDKVWEDGKLHGNNNYYFPYYPYRTYDRWWYDTTPIVTWDYTDYSTTSDGVGSSPGSNISTLCMKIGCE